MYRHHIPADSSVNASNCNTCCCTAVSASPGSVDRWTLMYGAWSTPLGGAGITLNAAFDIVKRTPSATTVANNPPVANLFLGTTPNNTLLSGTLAATDVEGDALTYAVLPLYGPKQGTVVITNVSTGAFTYTPINNFSGYDRFFWTVDDGVNSRVVGEAIIAVNPATGPATPVPTATMATPVIRVRPANVSVSGQWQALEFPLEVSPQAKTGDTYRMTVREQAVDCDCREYYRTDCWDITIGNCR